jgi:hypothetical protein
MRIFWFDKCPIKTHDGANTKFSSIWDERITACLLTFLTWGWRNFSTVSRETVATRLAGSSILYNKTSHVTRALSSPFLCDYCSAASCIHSSHLPCCILKNRDLPKLCVTCLAAATAPHAVGHLSLTGTWRLASPIVGCHCLAPAWRLVCSPCCRSPV